MSKPQPIPTRPAADQNDPPQVSREELDVIRERDRTYPRDREAARPADDVVKRLLERHPAP
jgi:hypothetical protein